MKERGQVFFPSLPPSIFPFLPTSRTVREMKKKKVKQMITPHVLSFYPPTPPVFTAWCGVTQIVRSGDFPWARAIAGGDILAVSAVFTVVLCHVFLGSCRFSPHSLPPIPLLTLSSSLPSPSSVFPSCFSPIVARSQGRKKKSLFPWRPFILSSTSDFCLKCSRTACEDAQDFLFGEFKITQSK